MHHSENSTIRHNHASFTSNSLFTIESPCVERAGGARRDDRLQIHLRTEAHTAAAVSVASQAAAVAVASAVAAVASSLWAPAQNTAPPHTAATQASANAYLSAGNRTVHILALQRKPLL